jgi:hypothetical protein
MPRSEFQSARKRMEFTALDDRCGSRHDAIFSADLIRQEVL